MVKIMTEILRNMSSLLVEAHERYPDGGKKLHTTKVNTKVNDTIQYVTNNEEFNSSNSIMALCDTLSQETKKTDDWIKTKKVCMPRNFKDNGNNSDENTCSILEDYNSEEEDELSEDEPGYPSGMRRETLSDDMRNLEKVLEIKTSTMQLANKKLEEVKAIVMQKDDEIKNLKVVQELHESEILDMSHQIKYLIDESEDRKERIQVMENEAIQCIISENLLLST